ncbi:hypothetical protein DH2020_036322 [Rehmannia glutinosa]|uniref:F-box associated beta-propeller type 1 domain-containing protein n=1 Tax=Rehmannia glutinosa TaxID=99300 RepID=A0ABR0V517_REHGL
MMLPGRDKSSEEFTLDADFVADCAEGTRRTSNLNNSSKIVGPVNGLICIYGMGLSERIALCNPCLRESETLPRSPTSCNISYEGYFFRCVGLGYDSVQKDVKIVQMINYFAMEEGEFTHGMLVDVYSRNAKTWRKLVCNVPNTWAMKSIAASHNNNGSFFHCLAWEQLRDPNDFCKRLVLSFDVRKEVFRTTLFPPCVYDGSDYGGRAKVRSKVLSTDNSLFLFVWEDGDKFLDRWVLNGLGNVGRWTRLSRVGPLLQVSKPVGFWKTNGLVLKYVKEKKLVIYDCSTGETRNIEIRETVLCYPKVVGYRGSLVSLAARVVVCPELVKKL